jgi:ADP-heptose:LPS heptosyltransferase
LKISQLKLLDKSVGCFLIRYLPSVLPAPALFAQGRILLIRPGGIGDAVLLSPAIHSLKNTHPAINITVLAEQRNAGVFSLIPGVDRLLCYDRPRELLQALLGSYDVVIDTEQWHRLSAIVARIASAPVKIGFDTNERRRMFTHPVPYSHDDYESLSFIHLLAPLGIASETVETRIPFLSLPGTASGKAADLLEPLRDQPFVTVFPGASIPERRWGADRFRQVADNLAQFGVKTVVVGGKDDRRQGDMIVGGGSGLNLAGLTSLSGTAAVIQKSAAERRFGCAAHCSWPGNADGIPVRAWKGQKMGSAGGASYSHQQGAGLLPLYHLRNHTPLSDWRPMHAGYQR